MMEEDKRTEDAASPTDVRKVSGFPWIGVRPTILRLSNLSDYREAVEPQSPGLTREARLPWEREISRRNPDGVAPSP
jgi:hypothetical protein